MSAKKMINTTPRVFTHAEAVSTAAAYAAGDPEWTYAAEPFPGYGPGAHVVSVTDEAGAFVAYVPVVA